MRRGLKRFEIESYWGIGHMRVTCKIWLTAMVAFATLSACSTQSAIEKMATPNEKALAIGFAEALCNDSIANFKNRTDAKLWTESQPFFSQIKKYCPQGKAKSRLMGYHFYVSNVSGVSVKQVRMVVVSESPNKWTTTTISTLSEKGTLKVVGWNINATPEKPAEIAALEQWDSTVGYLQFGLPLLLLVMIGSVVWFYRRAKKSRTS
jgi:hypothetical protein